MHKALPAMLVLALAVAASAPPTAVAGTPASPSPTQPPLIYHIITRPLCSELHKHIAPAIAMMLQNDQNLKKGPDLFSRYNRAALSGSGSSYGGSPTSGGSAGSTMTPEQNMVLLGMENLVSPIANNIIAIQRTLDTPALMNGTGNVQDDAQLQAMRAKLLKALASQNAALDLISGFVATQQMADLQHSGQEYIGSITQSDMSGQSGKSLATPGPNPLLTNPDQAGLPANPYSIDLANIPGLTLGYNPVTRLLDAMHWTLDETTTRENDAAKSVMSAAQECAGPPQRATPHP
jgi:hypothetical protein